MLNKKNILIFLPILLLILVGTFVTVKKVSPLSSFWWGQVNVEDNIAVHGQDVVGYFYGESLKGEQQHSVMHDGVTYLFSNTDNAEHFSSAPNKFIPQFGGYCAFATGKGLTADISDDAWAIVENKLYLFADKDVKQQWLDEIKNGSLKQSHSNWNVAI